MNTYNIYNRLERGYSYADASRPVLIKSTIIFIIFSIQDPFMTNVWAKLCTWLLLSVFGFYFRISGQRVGTNMGLNIGLCNFLIGFEKLNLLSWNFHRLLDLEFYFTKLQYNLKKM